MAQVTVILLGCALFLWGHYVGYWQGVDDAGKYPHGSGIARRISMPPSDAQEKPWPDPAD